MTVGDAASEPSADTGGDERLLVLVSGSRDRELLVDWLATGYEVATAAPGEEWPAFDACLVDAGWYEQVRERLAAACERGAAHRPVLLLVPEARADEWVDRALDGPADDVLTVPTRKRHLHARLSSLLRARRLSRDLAAERDRFRALTESANDAIVTVDAEGVVRYANPAVETLFGRAPSELVGDPLTDLIPERFHDRHEAAFEAYLESGERTFDWSTVEFVGRHADGHEVPLEVSFSAYEAGGELRFTGILRDVTERKEREAELRATERQFEAVFQDPNILVGLLDTDGTVRDVNGTALEYIGADIDDVRGRPFADTPWFDEAATREAIRGYIERAAAGEYVEFEADLTRPDGEPYTVSGVFRPVTDEDGEVVSILVSDRDVTERKRLETELREETELLGRLFDTSPIAITVLDTDGDIVRANRTAKDVLRLDPATAVGRAFDAPDWQIFDESGDPVPSEELPFARVMATGERVTDYEHGIRAPDGEVVWLSISAAPLTGEDGEIRRVVAAMQDITTRRRQEQELQRTVDLFEQAQNIADIGAWEYDIREDRLVWSDQMWAIHGFDESFEPTLDGVLARYPADEAERIEREAEAVLESGGTLETEVAYETPDGEERWLHIHAEARFEDGEPVRLVGTTQDVTERHEQERRLATALDLLEQAQDIADMAGWEYDVEADEFRISDQAHDIHDLPPEFEFTPESYFDLFEGAARERLEDAWAATIDGTPHDIELAYETPDGEERWLLLHGEPVVEDGEVTLVRGTVQDVTEPLEREREVRRYETMVESAANPIYALDVDGRFTHANAETLELTELSREELLGEPAAAVFGEDIVTEVNDRIRGLLRDGDRTASFEVTFRTPEGETRTYRTSLSLLFEDGAFDGTVVVAQDITEIRRHERRLSVLDRVFRHNVRNRLNVVAGHLADLAQEGDWRAAAAADAVEDLHEMTESARRFQDSIRPGEADIETVDVVPILRELAVDAREEHPDVTVDIDLPAAAPARVPGAFALAVGELVDNAVEHTPRDPHVEVAARETADAVEVRVADNGPGIPEMTREVLTRGTETQLEHALGLGLWLVRWTVANAGGDLHIEDNEPGGTVVVLRFPAA